MNGAGPRKVTGAEAIKKWHVDQLVFSSLLSSLLRYPCSFAYLTTSAVLSWFIHSWSISTTPLSPYMIWSYLRFNEFKPASDIKALWKLVCNRSPCSGVAKLTSLLESAKFLLLRPHVRPALVCLSGVREWRLIMFLVSFFFTLGCVGVKLEKVTRIVAKGFSVHSRSIVFYFLFGLMLHI